jgi:hypothetical protein
VSRSEFALRLGVTPGAVSQQILRGKLSGAALTADGRIVVAEAMRQLEERVGRVGRPRTGGTSSARIAGELLKIRLKSDRLDLEMRERAAARERGEIADANPDGEIAPSSGRSRHRGA